MATEEEQQNPDLIVLVTPMGSFLLKLTDAEAVGVKHGERYESCYQLWASSFSEKGLRQFRKALKKLPTPNNTAERSATAWRKSRKRNCERPGKRRK